MARTTIRTEDITASEVTTAKMAVDPTNASNLSSGSVPLAQLGNVDTSGLEDDIALIGFKVASNGSLAKYNLVDQTVDDFQDATGVDATLSTNDVRNAAGKYYAGDTTPTGGTITSYTSGPTDYTVHTFLSTGTFKNGGSGTVDILVVGGGGGGGGDRGGGGGGGGLVTYAAQSISAGSQTVTVGTGGTGGVSGGAQGGDGGNSQFASLTASDGGGGGGYGAGPSSDTGGRDGGSGGGSSTSGAVAGGTATSGQGYNGGQSAGGGAGGYGGAGGGGAGAVGTGGGGSEAGGAGGAGLSNSYRTGSGVNYAGGGGGSSSSGTPGAGGSGGGGTGGKNSVAAIDGTDGLGGGGGGGSYSPAAAGGDGGDGIVVVRFVEDSMTAIADMTLVSTSTTAEATPTKGDIVMTYTDGAGTATVNTDLKAYVSRDDGTTYTQMTLASQGTTGGYTILTAHDVDISGQPSGTSMRYKIETLNQSASKETRIQAVSLGWS